MRQTLTPELSDSSFQDLRRANESLVHRNPGAGSQRQPVHTVYRGGQIFSSQTAAKMSQTALRTLADYAPDAKALVKALELEKPDLDLWSTVYARVQQKLEREAVEDFRIDFEDGYGNRPDAEEDGHAASA